ncbi:hypothetical protein D9619_012581 [Psilocybe cf. subviscida]|uniref:Uncharacterized protein n=1 Tax=Psilocybe cf. subviscida TaxID=2480587 RepID=A0A8H5B6N3_9AGAR|nr:hypothetical protein D9619_012581 [Psilocybe cf. subviscida]
MIGLHLHTRDFGIPADVDTTFRPFNGRTLLVEAVLVSADPMSTTMIMDWIIMGEQNSSCGLQSIESCTDINIFFDNNLISGPSTTGQPATSDRPLRPIFKLNATTFAQRDITANSPTFRTRLILFSPNNPLSSLLYYPFDTYSAEVFMFAEDAATNETIGVKIAKTRGIAVDFKTHVQARTDYYIPPGMIDFSITLSRGNLVKVFAVMVVVSIWLVTLILIILILTSVFFGFRQKTEVLIAPVATVFAFTQLRASMPGAPAGFGEPTTAFRVPRVEGATYSSGRSRITSPNESLKKWYSTAIPVQYLRRSASEAQLPASDSTH